jgi:hypothetical protein
MLVENVQCTCKQYSERRPVLRRVMTCLWYGVVLCSDTFVLACIKDSKDPHLP